MNTTNDHTDNKFRKLFEKTGLDSPSPGFTNDVMKRILQLKPEAEITQEKNSLRGWLGGIGIFLLAILGLSVTYFFDVGIFPENFKPILAPVFGSLFNSFKAIFDSVEVSSTTVVIILGFVFLIAIERILHRLRFTKNIYFSL